MMKLTELIEGLQKLDQKSSCRIKVWHEELNRYQYHTLTLDNIQCWTNGTLPVMDFVPTEENLRYKLDEEATPDWYKR